MSGVIFFITDINVIKNNPIDINLNNCG